MNPITGKCRAYDPLHPCSSLSSSFFHPRVTFLLGSASRPVRLRIRLLYPGSLVFPAAAPLSSFRVVSIQLYSNSLTLTRICGTPRLAAPSSAPTQFLAHLSLFLCRLPVPSSSVRRFLPLSICMRLSLFSCLRHFPVSLAYRGLPESALNRRSYFSVCWSTSHHVGRATNFATLQLPQGRVSSARF